MQPETVQLFNQLTVAAAALLACGFLWRKLSAVEAELKAARDTNTKDLRDFNTTVLYDLKARIMVCEDKLEISRQERMKYLPAATEKEKRIIHDLDGDPYIEIPSL